MDELTAARRKKSIKPAPEDEYNYTTKVIAIGAEVFISLPGDQYIKMTPEQARQIAGRLFREAALAAGEAPPSLIMLTKED